MLVFSSCDPDDPSLQMLTVVSPEANQTFSLDYVINTDYTITIEIEFNIPVQESTVILGRTMIIKSSDTDVDGSLTWMDNTRLRFTSAGPYGDFCEFHPDCYITMTLVGTDTGSGAVESKENSALDGDNDGVAGGNYTTILGILG